MLTLPKVFITSAISLVAFGLSGGAATFLVLGGLYIYQNRKPKEKKEAED